MNDFAKLDSESDLIDTERIETNRIPALKFDPDEYRDEIKCLELTKEQEDEFLQTLWDILYKFVELGWGVETVQHFLPDVFEKSSSDSVKLLERKDTEKKGKEP